MSNEDKYKKIFSKKLNYYMELRGKTQADIINDLGINKSAVSTWCNGTRLPRMNKVELLAKYLGVTVSDLINDNEASTLEFIATDSSMSPLLDIGDIAIIEKQEQNDFENGKTYLLELENKMLIRKIVNMGNSIELYAMNDKSIKTTKDKITIIGRVIKAENQSAFK